MIVAFAAFIVLFPIFILCSAALALSNGGSPFFLQRRPGLHAIPFYLIKFKTMIERFDDKGFLLPDEQRLTPLGQLIRNLSLDEIPQLLNVIIGEMSLVGPRPLLMEYLPLYTESQKVRHSVKPGITGWAQINGRNNMSWEEKFEYDAWYVNNISFFIDFKILFKTIFKVLKQEGINENGKATMSKFTGKI